MTRPRVLMVSPTGVMGGSESIFVNLIERASIGGYEPSVLLLRDGPLRAALEPTGVPMTLAAIGRFRDLPATATTMRGIAAVIHRERPDVVYSNMAMAHMYAALPAWFADRPALWHQGGIPAPASMLDRCASALPARCVLTVSSQAARAQRRLRPGPPVALFRPGIALDRFEAADGAKIRATHGVPPHAPFVGIVGRLQEWKGQQEFLLAAAEVAKVMPEAHFAVVGGAILGWEGDYPDRLRRLASELRIEDRVIFTGHTDDVPDWLHALDIVVNASAAEPFGLVVAEAMATGAVVVAVRSGGPADVITDSVNGLLCDAPEPRQIAERILVAARDRELRTRIATAARAHAQACFAADRMASDFGNILRRCLLSPNGGRRAREEADR
ncbi:MAG TPA: glycosyltransferase [Solirubrobacteraceae bacterium]|jgi:glycosyltransferase involved in cell wall biosynthesis|nr:glycosyltransferase [Solirubrobacteraceae bacterium]